MSCFQAPNKLRNLETDLKFAGLHCSTEVRAGQERDPEQDSHAAVGSAMAQTAPVETQTMNGSAVGVRSLKLGAICSQPPPPMEPNWEIPFRDGAILASLSEESVHIQQGKERVPGKKEHFLSVQVHVLKGDKAGEWWKFTINIISVYKQGTQRIRRGDQLLWVRAKDVACKCPKIKPGRKYLLMGSDDEDTRGQSGVVADRGSLLVPWKDLWARRLRKFQQRDKRGKC
ncbi:hypothetical protein DNTS_032805 [Danionella cerebrum]|uniref:NTR domain-containing protein n=1 Tax=Danionella cerebrum TaxID=2873325 RepID=A0A553QV49_9TELE|nr:hypothetical protein DNTS_032805 [Danionella translucida]